jgi:KDO2-lipid IV(A) lauroyltransferase
LSAHLGNFFLLGRCLEKKGYICHTLLNQPRHGRFNALMNHYLDQLGQRSIAARPRNDALRKLLEVLRRNETVVMIADEFRQGTGTPVPFFGRTVIARRGPATLAARTGAPIIPACLVRQSDGSLRLIIEPELELVKSDKSKPAIKENTLRLTQWLEKTVRRHPEQWNWMTVHWQDDSHQANPSKQHRFQSTTH